MYVFALVLMREFSGVLFGYFQICLKTFKVNYISLELISSTRKPGFVFVAKLNVTPYFNDL